MATVTTTQDILWDIGSITLAGQSPYARIADLDILGTWVYTDKLNDLKQFTFVVKNDQFNKANVLIEREISIPGITNFDGIITEKKPKTDSIGFTAKEQAWHLTRRKYNCHDIKRIRFTQKEWWNKLWKFRRRITIQGKFLEISTGNDIVNLPLLIRITDPELKAHALSSADDVAFTIIKNDDTIIKLDHEIEEYVSSTGELNVWVKFPALKSGQNLDFEMYFGNPNASNQENITGVWNERTDGEWHLHADSLDSTSNNNDGTDTAITREAGFIADAARFDGVDSKIDVGSDATLDDTFDTASGTGGWISCWIKPKSDGEGSAGRIFDKVNWLLAPLNEASGLVRLQFFHDFDGAADGRWDTAVDIPLNDWTKVDIVYDNGNVANDPIIYINGQPRTIANGLLTESVTPIGTRVSDSANNLVIGNTGAQDRTFDGLIDEVRVTKVTPANISEIIAIEYNNHKLNSSMMVIKQVEFFIEQADIIAENIIASANRDMPLLSRTKIDNLQSLIDFNDDVLDGTLNANNGTWTGTETYTGGFFNSDKAGKFNGSSRVNLANETNFDYDIADPFSIVFWINTTNSGTSQILVAKRTDQASGSRGYSVSMTTGNTVIFELSNNPTEFSVTSTQTIADGLWHHIACTYDGSQDRLGMKIYIDGLLSNTGIATAITGTIVNDLTVSYGGGSAGADDFTGLLDDGRFYDDELTSKEVEKLKKMTQSDLTFIDIKRQWKLGDGKVTNIDNLVSLHKFDQSLLDSKSTNNALVIDGSELYADGKYTTKAFDFDGSTYLKLANESNYDFQDTDSWSVSFWMKTSTTGATQVIMSKRSDLTFAGWSIYLTSSNNLRFEFEGSSGETVRETSTNITDGEFHLIVCTYDGSQDSTGIKIYVDSIQDDSNVSNNSTGSILNNIQVSIGAEGDGDNKFTGQLDDARIYSDVLTLQENIDLFKATSSGIDRIRDDDIPTRLLDIEFNHKNHLESLRKVAFELGTDIYFESNDYSIFIRTKGKTVPQIFNTFQLLQPSFNLNSVSNVVNVVGSEEEPGKQREKTFTQDTNLRYNYEETFIDKQITTKDSIDLVGATLGDQLKDLDPNLTIKAKYNQFVKFDLASGDKIELQELDEGLQGIFRIIKIVVTPSQVTLTLNKSTKALVTTSAEGIGDMLNQLIKSIQDVQIDKG